MVYNRPVSNPILIGAIELMKAEDTPEHRKMVSDEIINGTYICPALMEPVPTKGEDGKYILDKNIEIRFPVIHTDSGKKYYMAFTDDEEFFKWKEHDKRQFFSASFDDYVGLLFKKNDKGMPGTSDGFVINPYGANIIVPKEMVAHYMVDRLSREEAKAKKAKQEDNA